MTDFPIPREQSPAELDRDLASWQHLQAQIRVAERQARWEPFKAIAMILIAAAAIAAAGGIAGRLFSAQPQTIVVHFEQPLAVKVQP